MPTVGAKVSEAEMMVWKERAEACGETVAAYVRRVVNEATGVAPARSVAIVAVQEQIQKVKSRPTLDGMCGRCTGIGAPACPACIEKFRKNQPSAAEVFAHLE